MQLLMSDDVRLRKKSLPFDFEQEDLKAIDIANELVHQVMSKRALGIAAPQIGIFTRIFIFTHGESFKTAVNPEILYESKETVVASEGCLSYPKLFIHKKRPAEIKVAYQDCDGLPVTLTLQYYEARCFLHEYEHLDGVLLLDNLSFLKRKMAMKRWKNIKK